MGLSYRPASLTDRYIGLIWSYVQCRSPKFIWAPFAQLFSLAETRNPPPPPHIWAHIRERYWSPRIDDISQSADFCALYKKIHAIAHFFVVLGTTCIEIYSVYRL
jgi:hypothetical protein